MDDRQVQQRRLTFGSVAELYEQVRPSYPPELVDEVTAYAELAPGDRILDVGAGTGKATRLFAGRGHEIVALEPSAEMAAVARETLRGFPEVTLVQAEFESWELPPEPFKLMISAQAWHWLDPKVRFSKARAALVPGGAWAAFWNHADWRNSPLHPALLEAYHQAAPDFQPTGPMHPLGDQKDWISPGWEADLTATDGFEQPERRVFPWRERYSTDEYLQLVSTHSDHIVLDGGVRERLLARIGAAIDADGGVFEMAYVTHLCLARAV